MRYGNGTASGMEWGTHSVAVALDDGIHLQPRAHSVAHSLMIGEKLECSKYSTILVLNFSV